MLKKNFGKKIKKKKKFWKKFWKKVLIKSQNVCVTGKERSSFRCLRNIEYKCFYVLFEYQSAEPLF